VAFVTADETLAVSSGARLSSVEAAHAVDRRAAVRETVENLRRWRARERIITERRECSRDASAMARRAEGNLAHPQTSASVATLFLVVPDARSATRLK